MRIWIGLASIAPLLAAILAVVVSNGETDAAFFDTGGTVAGLVDACRTAAVVDTAFAAGAVAAGICAGNSVGTG